MKRSQQGCAEETGELSGGHFLLLCDLDFTRLVAASPVKTLNCRSSGGGTCLEQNKHPGKVWFSGSVQTESVVMWTSCGVGSPCVCGRVDGTVASLRKH